MSMSNIPSMDIVVELVQKAEQFLEKASRMSWRNFQQKGYTHPNPSSSTSSPHPNPSNNISINPSSTTTNRTTTQNPSTRPNQPANPYAHAKRDFCYQCNQQGHISNNCPIRNNANPRVGLTHHDDNPDPDQPSEDFSKVALCNTESVEHLEGDYGLEPALDNFNEDDDNCCIVRKLLLSKQ
ncbi:hypothetical protein FRX31_012951, partial [Thalictrum thalictroides]